MLETVLFVTFHETYDRGSLGNVPQNNKTEVEQKCIYFRQNSILCTHKNRPAVRNIYFYMN